MLKRSQSLKSHREIERSAAEILERVLTDTLGRAPESLPPRVSSDKGGDLAFHAGGALFVVEAKSRLWPSDVPAVAQSLKRRCRSNDELCVPVVMAPDISERTAERCLEEGIGWADLAGNCHIQFDRMLIHVQGKTGERGSSRGTSSLYTPRAARIVHALLAQPQSGWKVVELAERTGVSLGQVSNVRKLLLQNAFAEATSEGVRLIEPQRLLLDWSRNYRPRRTIHRYYSLRRPDDLEKSLADRLTAYALTELAAAERYAPFTRYQSVAFYVPSWGPGMAKELDLRPAEGTPNVSVYEDPDGLLFAEEKGSVKCASPILTYLDLTLLGGRGQDAAEQLFETTIVPGWR